MNAPIDQRDVAAPVRSWGEEFSATRRVSGDFQPRKKEKKKENTEPIYRFGMGRGTDRLTDSIPLWSVHSWGFHLLLLLLLLGVLFYLDSSIILRLAFASSSPPSTQRKPIRNKCDVTSERGR